MDSDWGVASPPPPPVQHEPAAVAELAVASAVPVAAQAAPMETRSTEAAPTVATADTAPTVTTAVVAPMAPAVEVVPTVATAEEPPAFQEAALPPPPPLPQAVAAPAPAPVPLPAVSSGRTLPGTPVALGRSPSVAPPKSPSRPPQPITTVAPTVVTAADFQDDLAALGRTRPNRALLGMSAVAVTCAFVAGLLVGRGTAPAALAPVPTPEAPAARPSEPPTPPAATPTAAAPTVPATPATPQAAAESAPPLTPDAPKSTGGSKSGLTPFNAKAAKTNLANAAARLRGCKDASPPAGSASVVITFAPTGRVSDVTVTTPTYAGTRAGNCIVAKLKTTRVPPFSGRPETVKKVVAIK